MTDFIPQTFAQFSTLDFVAFTVLIVMWFFMHWVIELDRPENPSTHSLIRNYRFKWMQEATKRDAMIFDSNILAIQQRSASIFMSASMIAIGGGVALLGRAEELQGVVADISTQLAAPRSVWEIKILVVLMFLVAAFLKFVWATRLFGYCSVVMAAIPNRSEHEAEAIKTADKAAALNVAAARSFNRGLRNMYFALTALVWILGAYALLVATLLTGLMLYRREFHSQSRAFLMEHIDD